MKISIEGRTCQADEGSLGWLGWGSCLQQVRRGNLSSQGQAPDSGFLLEKEFVNVVVKSNPSAGEE